jgi:ribose transport system permease protein
MPALDERRVDADAPRDAPPGAPPARRGRGLLAPLSFRNASALYVFAALFLIFSLWIPDLFLRGATWRALLDDQAVTALVAVGLVVPLAAGAFDLAVGAEVGLAAIVVAWLLVPRGVPLAPALVLTLVAGAAVGLASGLLIVLARIDSFIGTLGVSSILLALVQWISGGSQILGLPAGIQKLGTGTALGVTYPVYVMLGVAVAAWFLLERTPAGRRVYATGGNSDAARLAGVRTGAVVICSLVACGLVAALAGTLLSARLGTGDPTIGVSYLLPAFSAAFLGSTQFRGGRFNVWGTIVAVYVLATGVKGLQLAGAPTWIPDLFNGVALLVAVGMSKVERAAGRTSAIRRVLRRGAGNPEARGPA